MSFLLLLLLGGAGGLFMLSALGTSGDDEEPGPSLAQDDVPEPVADELTPPELPMVDIQDDDDPVDIEPPVAIDPPVFIPPVIEQPVFEQPVFEPPVQIDPPMVDQPVADDQPPAEEDQPEPVVPPVAAPDMDASDDFPDLADSAYDIGWKGLSAEEQLVVELVNRARMDPLGEVAREGDVLAAGISTAPKEALAVVPTLSDAAEAHSEDMDNRDFFAHTNPNGERPWDRAEDAGHENTFVGENIGWIGSSRTSFDEQARAEDHHTNLWFSDGHQQNLMSEDWSEIGVGYDYGDYRGYEGSTFVTEKFGDTGETYLTGVVIQDDDSDAFYDIGEGLGDVRITAVNGDTAYTTSTWESGGYSLELPPGTYQVQFEGGALSEPYETEVTIGNQNVKLDVYDVAPSAGGASAATLNVNGLGLPAIPVEEETLAAMHDDEEIVCGLF